MVRGLGRLESALMECLWSSGRPLSVREVQQCVDREKLAYTTIMSTLSTLYRKGLLAREADGRAYRYAPVQDRESYSAELMSDVLAASHDPQATLLRLVEQLTPEQAHALREVLGEDEIEQPRTSGESG
jgi:predicted transcriptional regulator